MNLKQKILLKIEKEMKKNYVKGMSSDFATLDPDDLIAKKIKKILREKHPGYEKNSIDGEAFDSACETISFYLTRGRIEEARAVLNVIPFVPIDLSEKEIENIIQEYSKKKRLKTLTLKSKTMEQVFLQK